MPKTIDGWILVALALMLLGWNAYMSTIQGSLPVWTVVVNAVIGGVALALRGGGLRLGDSS